MFYTEKLHSKRLTAFMLHTAQYCEMSRTRGQVPLIRGQAAHASWARAPIHHGLWRPYIMGYGAHASWAGASMPGTDGSCFCRHPLPGLPHPFSRKEAMHNVSTHK
jgi:hypothetical protein